MTSSSFIPPTTSITTTSPEAITTAMRQWSLGPLLADLDGAVRASAQALAAAETLESPEAIAHASLILGGAHGYLGNLSLAETHLTRSLDTFTMLDDAWGIASATIRMNLVWSGRGHFQLGNDQLMAILPMTQAVDDPILNFSILNDLGGTYRGLDALDLAIPYALEAHRIADRTGDPISLIFSRSNLGSIHQELLDVRHATDLFEEALAVIDQHPQYARFAMFSEHNLGEMSLQLKHYDTAIEWYGQAVDHGRHYANDEVLVESLHGSARAHLMLKAHDQAAILFTEALDILNHTEYRNDATHALATWHLESLRGIWTWETVLAVREALSHATRVQIRIELLQALAESTTHLGDLAAANAHLREALEEQERYWQQIALQQSHMAIQVSQANEARQEAERAWREHESIGKAMQEIVRRNAQNEALVGELQLRSATLDRMVREDSLTGTANRRAFDGYLRSDVMRNRRALTIVLTDIDNFKQINDQYSHVIGDRVLVATANILKQIYRDAGISARFGGDEFVVVLHDMQHEYAVILVQRFRNAVRAYPWRTIAPGLTVTLSIGVVTFTESETVDLDDPESLLALVDQRLYEAKRAGKDRVVA